MQELPADPPGIDALPDPLLADVLVVAGRSCGSAAALVCHRWRRLILSEPRLWPRLTLRTSGLEGALAARPAAPPGNLCERWFLLHANLLLEVGRGLAVLHVPRCVAVERAGAATASRWRLPDLLALLHPAALHELLLCGASGLPAGVAAHLQCLTCLTSLTLSSMGLADLPPGLPLAGLRELDLSCNRLEQLPLALVHTPGLALTRLSLSRNQLASLPLGPYLAGLRHLDISLNWFHSLPRSLADATSLRRLVLWSGFGSGLELSVGDVDGVLARMHMLRTLELRGSRTPHAVWEHLRRRLPHLQLHAGPDL